MVCFKKKSSLYCSVFLFLGYVYMTLYKFPHQSILSFTLGISKPSSICLEPIHLPEFHLSSPRLDITLSWSHHSCPSLHFLPLLPLPYFPISNEIIHYTSFCSVCCQNNSLKNLNIYLYLKIENLVITNW